jgi:hypothetical protein
VPTDRFLDATERRTDRAELREQLVGLLVRHRWPPSLPLRAIATTFGADRARRRAWSSVASCATKSQRPAVVAFSRATASADSTASTGAESLDES